MKVVKLSLSPRNVRRDACDGATGVTVKLIHCPGIMSWCVQRSFYFKKNQNKFRHYHCLLLFLNYRCLKIREFRIQSVKGKNPVDLEKYSEKKFALPLLQSKAIFQKIVLRYYFLQSIP
jgi:hypothetical protein